MLDGRCRCGKDRPFIPEPMPAAAEPKRAAGGATAAASDGQQAKRIAELEAQLAADRVTGNTCISLRAYVQAGAARGREGEKRGPRGGGGNQRGGSSGDDGAGGSSVYIGGGAKGKNGDTQDAASDKGLPPAPWGDKGEASAGKEAGKRAWLRAGRRSSCATEVLLTREVLTCPHAQLRGPRTLSRAGGGVAFFRGSWSRFAALPLGVGQFVAGWSAIQKATSKNQFVVQISDVYNMCCNMCAIGAGQTPLSPFNPNSPASAPVFLYTKS